MSKLTQAQRTLLKTMEAEEALSPDVSPMTLNSLVARGLLERQGESVTITAAGREAIAATAPAAAASAPSPQDSGEPAVCDIAPSPSEPRKLAGKLGLLLEALREPNGATLESLMAATGWQAHSVRGALSGALKTKRGIAVLSEKIDGVRRYRVEAQA